MKNRKSILNKCFAILMLMVMGFGVISFTKGNIVKVYASEITETSVAKIGEDGYESLEDAIEAVNDGETIVILKPKFHTNYILYKSKVKKALFGAFLYILSAFQLLFFSYMI